MRRALLSALALSALGSLLLASCVGLVSGPPSPSPAGLAATPPPSLPRAVVTRVVDGDTLEVRIGISLERVRLIGIDTPEVYERLDCFGREASAFTTSLLPLGTIVGLEKDVSERDRYGRLLRYVYLPDGRMLDEVLVAEGYAQVVTYPPDVKYQERFLAAQRAARGAAKGLWKACTALREPTPVSTFQTPTGNCDPSYPDVCIPSPPPDLDCPDIPYRRFRVLQPDPHHFDLVS